MKVNDRVVNIIEDHACVTQFLDQVCCALQNDDLMMPNYVPVLHDTLVTDQLGIIAKNLTERRKRDEVHHRD